MSSSYFMLGVADVRAGRGYRPDYDTWCVGNFQWDYDRGRLWATLAPKTVPVKRAGKVTAEAVLIYMQHLDEIL